MGRSNTVIGARAGPRVMTAITSADVASTRPDAYDLREMVVILWRRKLIVVLVAFLLVSLAAVAVAAAPQRYESTTRVVPLAHEQVVHEWLTSRQAAALVLDIVGDRLRHNLALDAWDVGAKEPQLGLSESALVDRLRVSTRVRADVLDAGGVGSGFGISVSARTLWDPGLAQEVAGAYLLTLETLRPDLERLTAAELLARYVEGDGDDEASAEARARAAAAERGYWLVFDPPNLPRAPMGEGSAFYLVSSGVAGLVIGAVVALSVERARAPMRSAA